MNFFKTHSQPKFPQSYDLLEPGREDAEGLVQFLNQEGGETDFLTFGLNQFPLSVTQERDFIANLKPNNIMLIARHLDKIISVGTCLARLSPREAHILDLGLSVLKEYWGMGVGSTMLDSLIHASKATNCCKIALKVRKENAVAINMYKGRKFIVEGLVTKSACINGQFHDDYIMSLDIAEA